jgi:hypothetical protein
MVDLRSGSVIINYKGDLLQLVKERISQFSTKGRKFVLLHPAGMSPDFYELLYEGNIKMYAHRQKKMMEGIDGMTVVREFEEQTWYYAMIKNELHAVRSKNDFLKLFPNQIQQMKAYIGEKKLRFKKSFEKDLLVLSVFCDRLELLR